MDETQNPSAPLPSEPAEALHEHASAPLSTSEAKAAASSTASIAKLSAFTNAMDGLQALAVTVTIAVFVICFLVQAFTIPSESMEDTLLVGDYLLVDKTRYAGDGAFDWMMPYRPIHRGDMVVFRPPQHPSEHYVKRVIGLPGERMKMVRRRVYINGQMIWEPYVVFKSSFPDAFRDNFPNGSAVSPEMTVRWHQQMKKWVENGELIIPRDMYFVMGDNRNQSADSRYWGFVPRENIVGRPLLIYWSMDAQVDDGDDDAPSPLGDKLLTWRDRLALGWKHLRWHRMFHLVR